MRTMKGETMAIMALERTLEQRRRALERANDIRIRRAALKRDLFRSAHARRDVVGMLFDPPPEIETMKVFDLLAAMPRYGDVKVGAILKRCQVSPVKTVGGMTERQRHNLVAVLGGRS